MPTLLSVTGSSLYILSKIHASTFSVFRILVIFYMKLGSLSKLGKKNMMTSTKFDGDVKSRN